MKNMLETIPDEITYDDEFLHITWKDKVKSSYNILELRKICPCVICMGGHGGKIGAATGDIKSAKLHAWNKVGRYALNLIFNDNHATGIFTFDSLRELWMSKIKNEHSL